MSSESSQNRAVDRTQTDSGALSNDQVVAANRASGDDLEPESANVAEEDSLNLSASSGVLASLLDERETEDSLMVVSFCRSQVDGSFPRFPLVSFLPVTDADTEFDHRLPLVSMSLPRKISHVQGSSQEYFVVEYLEPQICRDGRSRRHIYYRCDPSTIEKGSAEHDEIRRKAKAKAWQHVEQAIANKVDQTEVVPEFGLGPLSKGHGYVYHGDGHEGFVFYVHPKELGPLTTATWIPNRDTLHGAHGFCCNCEFVRKRSDGVEIWKCLGHDSSEIVKHPESDLPVALQGLPLSGLTLVEVFSGEAAKGGCQLSRAFEECGGTAVRYDIAEDSMCDLLQDPIFWRKHVEKPALVYHFAIPSSHFDPVASDTGRSQSKPEGNLSDPKTCYYNSLALFSLSLGIQLIQTGCLVSFELPLFSYLWMLPEFKAFLGMKGIHVIRCDYCQHGTPYQRCGLFVGNNPHLPWMATTCTHVGKHPERVTTPHTRRCSPYPRSLCFSFCETLVAVKHDNSQLLVAKEALTSSGLGTVGKLGDCSLRPHVSKDGLFNLCPIGERRLSQVRSGSSIAWYDLETDVHVSRKRQLISDTQDSRIILESFIQDPGSEQALNGVGSLGFERVELSRLLCLDPDFCDIIVVRELLQKPLELTPDELFLQIKDHIRKTFHVDKRVASRTAAVAIKQASDYLFDGILFRYIFDDIEQSYGLRAVVPTGGLRSFWYNGRKYRLSVRKSLLLQFHDSETMGGHSSREDTLAKLRARVWWPSMSEDVRKWVKTCSVCKLTKPQRGLTAEQRTQLYDRPFRVLFIDSVGPISPFDRGFSWLIHASCPFTGYAWVKPAVADTAETVARFLVEGVFFDICGFPAVLRSDRGSSYTGSVVKAVNELLGVTQAFGSAFHPEAQGHIEGSHKRINNILAAFAAKHPSGWSRWAKLAQWCIRCTPQHDKGNKTPYELVTGMIPQGPLDKLFGRIESVSVTDPSKYVQGLKEHLQSIHSTIAAGAQAEFERRQTKFQQKAAETSTPVLKVGDFVFVRRVPLSSEQVSKRLLPNADPRLFQIHKFISPETVVLCYPDTRNTDIGISQPIHMNRLIPYDLCELDTPISEGDLKLEVIDRNGRAHKATVVSQTATGLVRLRWETGDEEFAELSGLEYRWLG